MIIDAVEIHRKVIHPDSLQVTAYFKKLSEKRQPTWQKAFIDRTSSNTSSPIMNSNSTSRLFSIDVLSVLSLMKKKKTSDKAQQQLLEMKDIFIEQHYDSVLVKQVTGLTGAALTGFMIRNKPMPHDLNDTVLYELIKHIKTGYHEEAKPNF